jgi:myosin heavy subunit
MLEKNRNQLSPELVALMASSADAFVCHLAQVSADSAPTGAKKRQPFYYNYKRM